MKENIYISGFADEISPDFTEQLKTVTSLGMHYISLRSADGKNIAEYTPDEVREKLMPRLAQYGVKVSSIGSPVGKVGVEDEAGFAEHLAGLERCVRSASCWTAAISACSVSSSPTAKIRTATATW